MKKFRAVNTQEALNMAKKSIGQNVQVASTRTIRRTKNKKIKDHPMVEITAKLENEEYKEKKIILKKRNDFSGKVQNIIALSSGKGGVGTTTIAINLGYVLAKAGKKVLVVDGDVSLGNIDTLLRLKPKFNLYHVLAGEKEMEDVMVNGPGGIKIIPAPSGVPDLSCMTGQQKLFLSCEFHRLSRNFDIILLDAGSGISSNVIYFCAIARDVFLVITRDLTAMKDTSQLIKALYEANGIKKFKILANIINDDMDAKYFFRQFSKIVKKISTEISLNYLGRISSATHLSVQQPINLQKEFLESCPSSKWMKSFVDLSEKIL